MFKIVKIFILFTLLLSPTFANDIGTLPTSVPTTQIATQPSSRPAQILPKNVAGYLQDVSVTIHAGGNQGSGTLVTRNGINYIWTAGHVVASNRTTREIIDPKTGVKRTVVEFNDAQIVKELVENGRSVGQVNMQAEVIRYSNAESGEDLALLRVRKVNFVSVSGVFFLEDFIPEIGTELFHCGSLQGQIGSNSMTTGIVSQIGRVFQKSVYDQTTCPAFPGSSGGGIFLKDGRYVGMLTRGAGETFNLIIPIRRLQAWAKKVGVEFTIDESVSIPSEEELRKYPVEDTGTALQTYEIQELPTGPAL